MTASSKALWALATIVATWNSAFGVPPNNDARLSSARKELERRQKVEPISLGLQPRTYSQADLEAWVQHYQSAMIQSRLSAWSGTSVQDRVAAMEDVQKSMLRLRASGLLQLPTPYEDPRTYLEMAILCQQLEEGMVKVLGQTLAPRPVFGTVPTKEIQAGSRRWGSEYLVTFESGLLVFADVLSGIVVQVFRLSREKGNLFSASVNESEIRQQLDANPTIVGRLEEAIRAYLAGPSYLELVRTTRPRLDDAQVLFASMLYRSMLLFALAHEYGHVIILHKNLAVEVPENVSQQWAEEMAADGWGVKLSMIAAGSPLQNLAMGLWGMKFMLACMDLLERSRAIVATGTEVVTPSADDHPPSQLRIRLFPNYLRQAVQNFSVPAPPTSQQLEAGLQEAAQLDAVFGLLWERLRPALLSLHTESTRSAAAWRSSKASLRSPQVEQAENAYKSKDYNRAVSLLRQAAARGDPNGQDRLGEMYLAGVGVPADFHEAARLFRAAADQGLAVAQNNLGALYGVGLGVPKDHAEAIRWYRLAAEQGFALAQDNLGSAYRVGQGVELDNGEAIRWYRLAADQGEVDAQNNLGFMYEHGLGVPPDCQEAMNWYRRAAGQAHAGAQYNLGQIYALGHGVPQDFGLAAVWYRQAARNGLAEAENNLGVLYRDGLGVPKDHIEAYRLFTRAIAGGNLSARSNLEKMKSTMTAEQISKASAPEEKKQ